jgi:UDP-glucuronate decarboxylase
MFFIGSKSKIVNFPATQDDPKKRKPDISKVRQEFSFSPLFCFPQTLIFIIIQAKYEIGWYPKFSVRQGIQETIDYFRERLDQLEGGDYARLAP